MEPEGCVFCGIARGEAPAHVVYEDDSVVAFLDGGPIRPGHTQVIPREHFAYFDDLPEALIVRIVSIGQRLARAMKQLYEVQRVGFAFTGSDIAHVHAHVVPLHEATDITSRQYIIEDEVTFAQRPRPSDEEYRETVRLLREALSEIVE